MPSAYCGECEWEHRVDGDEPGELSRAMIDHFVETGHSPVERCDADARLPSDERTDPADGPDERARDPPKK